MKTPKKPIRGTREWAVANIDCCTGCPHDCQYCYARYDAVERKKLVTAEEWRLCRVREEDVKRDHPLYPGQVMFPTTHDIVPENIKQCVEVLRTLLEAGNRVLIVSKPHPECIRILCDELKNYREQVLFRFTITARDAAVLAFWEPNAPDYSQRKSCLQFARREGFQTSVSIEPMLDTGDVVAMVRELLPHVSHSIWLGKMNKIDKRVKDDTDEAQRQISRIEAGQTDGKIVEIYEQLRAEPMVRWKESIKTVVGIELMQEAGKDI